MDLTRNSCLYSFDFGVSKVEEDLRFYINVLSIDTLLLVFHLFLTTST